jgi:hypothetical protein
MRAAELTAVEFVADMPEQLAATRELEAEARRR